MRHGKHDYGTMYIVNFHSQNYQQFASNYTLWSIVLWLSGLHFISITPNVTIYQILNESSAINLKNATSFVPGMLCSEMWKMTQIE